MSERYTKFDWGNITPEFYNGSNNTAILVANYFMESTEGISRCIRFIKGRVEWYRLNLPKNCKIEIRIDDLGQSITEEDRQKIFHELKNSAENIRFLSRG